MKILYVITGADIGGAQKHLLYLSQWFSRKGHTVHVIVGEDGPLIKELNDQNIGVTLIPIPRNIVLTKDIRALWKVCRFIRQGKYNVVHSHSSKAGIIARIAGFLNRIEKNIFTAHGFVFTDPTLSKKKKAFYLFLEKVCSLLSTHIITVSNFDIQQGKEHGINEKKMVMIHNGIPDDSIISSDEWEKKQKRLRESNKRVIGFVGRFASEKNIDMLLRVAGIVKEQLQDKDVEFWLIGDGPLFDHYQNKVKVQDLESIVRLKGSHDNVLDWMDQMHAMVITSHKEGLPFVLLEACGRGLPVISTDVGGVKEVLDPKGKMKLIVPINDDNRMYNLLSTIITDHFYRETLGRYILGLSNTHTVDQMCTETNKIYMA
ncbi:MAG: glycosyltransferase [Bacillota bacterium]|nr:glycosyltransferase [Bacillota bacterium]